MTEDGFNQYKGAVNTDEEAKVIKTGATQNGDEFIFWGYKGEEYNYIIKIKDSKTGVLLGNPISKESAEECFNLLTFSKAE